MVQHPRISVITPSLNQGRYLRQTIESVLSQNYPDLEYIVVDGGSTDESVAILRQYSDRLTSWTSEPDRGQSDAINKGFARATGEIVAFLNSDDFYLPGALARVAEAFMANPNAGAVYGRSHFVAEDGHTLRTDGEPFDARRMLDGVYPTLTQPAVFVRRDAVGRVGYLDPELHYAFDKEFFWRVFANYEAVFIPHTLAAMRLHATSKSVALGSRFAPELERIAEKVIARPDAYPRFQIEPRRVRSAALLNGARFLYNNGLYKDAVRALGRSLRLSRRYAAQIVFNEIPRLLLHMTFGRSAYQAAGRFLHRPNEH
jgi:glycosyltransferase involved in cell wall biosynthesis